MKIERDKRYHMKNAQKPYIARVLAIDLSGAFPVVIFCEYGAGGGDLLAVTPSAFEGATEVREPREFRIALNRETSPDGVRAHSVVYDAHDTTRAWPGDNSEYEYIRVREVLE